MTEASDDGEVDRTVREAERAESNGDLAAAEHAFRRALRLQEARVGLEHPKVTDLLNRLGVICHHLGRSNEAEFLHRRALGIARQTLAADAPQIAASLQNLAALYRDQGKPEKLEKVASVGPQRSGLPGLDAGDEDERVSDVPQRVDDTDTVAPEQPIPVGAEPRRATLSDLWQLVSERIGAEPRRATLSNLWQLVSERIGQRAALVSVTGAVSLAIAWLVFGGGASTRGVGGTGQALGPSPGRTASVSDPGATDPPPADVAPPGVSPVQRSETSGSGILAAEARTESTEPVTQPLATPLEPLSGTTSLVVVEGAVCTRLVTETTAGAAPPSWGCVSAADIIPPGPVFFYTRIRSPTDAVVTHRWFHDGTLEHEIDLQIGANRGPGYRTYSMRPGGSRQRGAWRVELRSKNQDLLLAEEFLVR